MKVYIQTPYTIEGLNHEIEDSFNECNETQGTFADARKTALDAAIDWLEANNDEFESADYEWVDGVPENNGRIMMTDGLSYVLVAMEYDHRGFFVEFL